MGRCYRPVTTSRDAARSEGASSKQLDTLEVLSYIQCEKDGTTHSCNVVDPTRQAGRLSPLLP